MWLICSLFSISVVVYISNMVLYQLGRFCAWFLLWLFKLSFWFCLSKIMSLSFIYQPFLSLALRLLPYGSLISWQTYTHKYCDIHFWNIRLVIAIWQSFKILNEKKECMICFKIWGHWNSVDWIPYLPLWKPIFTVFIAISPKNTQILAEIPYFNADCIVTLLFK